MRAPSVDCHPTAIIYPDIPDNFRTRVNMQWPVYTFGRFESLERAARSEAAAAGQDVATITADVPFDAARAFWAMVTATESVRVVEEALAIIEAHLRGVKYMREVGLLAPNDVTVKSGDKTAYLVEINQAGIFALSGFTDQEMDPMVRSFCPNILFPYAREAVSDLVAKGGFPQLLLAPVNFDALYAQHLHQAQQQAPGSDTIN